MQNKSSLMHAWLSYMRQRLLRIADAERSNLDRLLDYGCPIVAIFKLLRLYSNFLGPSAALLQSNFQLRVQTLLFY